VNLRTRTVVQLVALVVPLTLFFSIYRFVGEKRYLQERVAERFAGRLLERSSRICEEHHGHWSARRHDLETFTYDVSFQPYSHYAPPFPKSLQSLTLSDEPVHTQLWRGPFDGATVVRTGMGGRCEIAVIYWPEREIPAMMLRNLAAQAIVLILVLVVTGWLISAPLVRRIRQLAHAVSEAPKSDFRIVVDDRYRDELSELGAAFNQAGERVAQTIADLHARDHTLKAYVANTTHDLAIPITVLQHRLQSLTAHVGTEDGKNALHTAMEESVYVAALVRNLNVSAKLDAREVYFCPTRVSLAQIMERVAQRHQPIAAQKKIELNLGRPEFDVEIMADSTLLEQALSNLVQNAVHYGRSGGHVAIVLECEGQNFDLRVIDDGPGIPAERLALVMNARERGIEARSRNPEGLGLGLAIVTSVCQIHGWHFEVKNQDPGLAAIVRGPLDANFDAACPRESV
jgi:signal transduction histidine kinase